MKDIRGIIDELGMVGIVAIALIAATAWFSITTLARLEERNARLTAELQAHWGPQDSPPWKRVSAPSAVDQLEVFYGFFERDRHIDVWLAKLYGAASAAGLDLKTGDYRLEPSRQRLARYQITLPVSGAYGEVRSFIRTALADMPVLSLDQLSFRRKSPNEGRIDAELSFSLYLARE